MKPKVGLYRFGRHRSMWGIWQYDSVSENGASAIFVKDVATFEEAVKEVYRLNGWQTNKIYNYGNLLQLQQQLQWYFF